MTSLRNASLAALLLCADLHAEDRSFWIEPCSVMTTDCQAGDAELARWALQAWEKASVGRLHFVETKDRDTALFRIRWADKNSGLYGEAVPIQVGSRMGAELHIQLPGNEANDKLLRDTIVYLTCLHESGHGLGLGHTRVFADIMYSFQYGGDLTEYFARYRRKLVARSDISKNSGMSEADQSTLIKRVTQAVSR